MEKIKGIGKKTGRPMFSFRMSENEYMALDSDYAGLCIRCGEEAYGVEPDARRYACESCDEPGVYGAQELMMADSFSS